MDIRQLTALLAIVDNGSFSAAAEALDTVQSNVSAHLKKLEHELGVTLIDRASCTLTSAGDIVAARARRAQREIEAIQSDVLALQHDVVGTVRVGIIGTTARWLVPRLLAVSATRFPELRLVFVESTTTALESQIMTGHVDVAVFNLPHASQSVLLTPLFEEDLVLVVRAGHPMAERQQISIIELAGTALLLPYKGTAFRRELDEAAATLGIRLTSKAEVDGTRLIASLTFEGHGPAILPAAAVPSYLADEWKSVRVRELPRRVVGVAQRPQTLPSAPARAVLDMLTQIVFDARTLPPGLSPVAPDRVRPSIHPRRDSY